MKTIGAISRMTGRHGCSDVGSCGFMYRNTVASVSSVALTSFAGTAEYLK